MSPLIALAAAWNFLKSPVGRYVALAVGVGFGLLAYGAKEHHDGYQECKVEWNASEAKTREAGTAARGDAVRDVERGVRDPYDSDDN